jgi:hypothetical protein
MNDFQSIVNQLTTMKMNLDEELQALMLLSSLPDSWETLVVSLSNFTHDGKMNMEQVTNNMFNEETRRQAAGVDNAQALVTRIGAEAKIEVSRVVINLKGDQSQEGGPLKEENVIIVAKRVI